VPVIWVSAQLVLTTCLVKLVQYFEIMKLVNEILHVWKWVQVSDSDRTGASVIDAYPKVRAIQLCNNDYWCNELGVSFSKAAIG